MKKLTWLIATILFLILTSAAFATPREQVQTKIEDKCASIQAKIANKITKFDSSKEKHVSAYNNLKDRITKFIKKFDEKGYDTSKIKTDLTTLNGKIDKFTKDYSTYINKLRETQTLACGHSEGQFKDTLVEAKKLLKIVHQDASDIRKYYRTEIRKDMTDLKKQK
ncbi:MAG: hypothetical protein NT135_00415 [Candidatus Berkelbacteria bacterium]|nr:hypothetical protein [Candidatus Berkelbacteria bacterium]